MRCWWIAALLVALSASAAHAQTKSAGKVGGKAAKKDAPAASKAAKKDAAAGKAAAGKAAAGEVAAGEVEDDGRPKPITVALLGGYGYALEAPSDVNPFGIGFGVRGGYSFDALYVGARFMFFLGDSEEVEGVEISANAITIGLESGYDIGFFGDVLVLRPELGLGLFSASIESMAEESGGGQIPIDESSEDLYITPGFALLVRIGARVFIGMDVMLPIIFDDDIVVEGMLLGMAGMRF